MSGSLTRGDRKLLLAAGAASLLLIALSVTLGSAGGDTTESATTYSAGSGGAKAVYLLLHAARYSVKRWEQSPRDLPSDANATLILADPQGAPTIDEQSALRRFIERGGRVIATGVSGAFFLPEHRVAPDPIAGMTWRRMSSRSPSFITRAAPDITLAPKAYWEGDASALPLYGDVDDVAKVRVIKADVGKGEVIWWASATPLTNAGLREPGNLEFVLACIGDAHRQILWDEYFHGHYRSLSASLMDSPFAWITLPFTLAAAAVLLTYSRRSGPIVAPAAESRLSPLEFVRTLGYLYQRAGAASVAVDISYQRFRYRLTRRAGITSAASVVDLERAVRARTGLDDQAFGDLLRACESAREDPRLRAAIALTLTRSLYDYALKLDLFRATKKEHA
jgi:Domain of unknown function (DUF4350)